jgi:deoxyribonuclease V
MALHLGAVPGLPTIGVTHRPLLASGDWLDDRRGATSPLPLDGEGVGAWLRTRAGARPLAIHPGWRTTAEVAVEVAALASSGHRTPEPFRRARWLARMARSDRVRDQRGQTARRRVGDVSAEHRVPGERDSHRYP